jgi:hypothetical protein
MIDMRNVFVHGACEERGMMMPLERYHHHFSSTRLNYGYAVV